ncbi:ABC transporter substrate-binding protein [Nannocystis pusilla]|uniref:ABC transporter substrate-binding protein n=1 Tax=Nannocystis pusilla TaxID=889268 RepID=UPI003B81FEFF
MPGLSRRTFHRLLGAGACATACSGGGASLALYNWGDYLAPEVVERFTAATGFRITQDYYLAEAELVAKLASGAAYDVVFPIDYVLERMRKRALLVPLARDKLPGLANLDPQFGPWIAADNQIYAVPYLWGTTGIGYDSDHVEAPTSWKALFDPRHAGKISVIDSKGDVFDQALLAAGMDINSTDKPAIRERVYPMLRAQKEILRAYDSNPARALAAGDTWIAQIDSGDLFRAQKQRPSLRYVIPEEGAVLWIDYLAIPPPPRSPGSRCASSTSCSTPRSPPSTPTRCASPPRTSPQFSAASSPTPATPRCTRRPRRARSCSCPRTGSARPRQSSTSCGSSCAAREPHGQKPGAWHCCSSCCHSPALR